MTALDEQMNRGIDALIEKLQEAKKTRTYLQRASTVQSIAEACNDYESYWTDRLYSLMD